MSYCERGTIILERASNGYTVTMRDPAIEKKNAQRSLKERSMDVPSDPYVDPKVEYVFTTLDDALKFLGKNADKALPKVNYESAFEALTGDD